MRLVKKVTDFSAMSLEEVVLHFSIDDTHADEVLDHVVTRQGVQAVLQERLGNLWEDNKEDKQLAREIRAYLRSQGVMEEDMSLTNTQKNWQRHLVTHGKKYDPVARRRAWLARLRVRSSRLFRRR